MIKTIRKVEAKCRHAGCENKIEVPTIQALREAGWSVSGDKKQAACPEHAAFYNHPGRGKKSREFVQTELDIDLSVPFSWLGVNPNDPVDPDNPDSPMWQDYLP